MLFSDGGALLVEVLGGEEQAERFFDGISLGLTQISKKFQRGWLKGIGIGVYLSLMWKRDAIFFILCFPSIHCRMNHFRRDRNMLDRFPDSESKHFATVEVIWIVIIKYDKCMNP
jgi:hypothetical protein